MSLARYVSVANSEYTHALLPVDVERWRTVCGKAAGKERPAPYPHERCPTCWDDWRVRGDQPRYVSPRPAFRLIINQDPEQAK
jgi:hypothetical protein